jgi:hypothetical protein
MILGKGNEGDASCSAQEEYDENEWCINQTLEEEMPLSESLLKDYAYGFANKHEGLGLKYEVSWS